MSSVNWILQRQHIHSEHMWARTCLCIFFTPAFHHVIWSCYYTCLIQFNSQTARSTIYIHTNMTYEQNENRQQSYSSWNRNNKNNRATAIFGGLSLWTLSDSATCQRTTSRDQRETLLPFLLNILVTLPASVHLFYKQPHHVCNYLQLKTSDCARREARQQLHLIMFTFTGKNGGSSLIDSCLDSNKHYF